MYIGRLSPKLIKLGDILKYLVRNFSPGPVRTKTTYWIQKITFLGAQSRFVSITNSGNSTANAGDQNEVTI
jgi:hypothetical protein